ncbi:ATP-dependent DNA helicase [Aureibacter tunicatorum]|uniref:ATP-dependent exoDNAse (Exonuclease V) alpha subunit n=1 Tax=Aureibacter tunicatorum TaxID=866807 RepID=A0AAE4BRU3_9BACT|nr:DEAD/DEAH box helicase [Aureibacter tunicatorum]MDR6237597.1 ATP-dependent exoDNAse (exonuclease V) alpha subunit [Aureibacter tunicatorum]BDD02631.1 hypothetical protein AUTU_01140 [Aureibacter tunicatorum]
MSTKNIDFSKEACEAINLIKNTRENIFITGKAGTGKSTLLSHIRTINNQNIIVLAPTGIAAINVNGDTIHSFFKLKPGYELDEAKNMRIVPQNLHKFQHIDTIIIDEISMVRADLLDAIDTFLQRARKEEKYFGGIRMIFIGDLYQLPPVVEQDDLKYYCQHYQSPYFFSAKLFQDKDLFTPGFQLKTIELNKVYRQSDQTFIDLLNKIRKGSIDEKSLTAINKRYQSAIKPSNEKNYINLVSTNQSALRINHAKLASIKKDEMIFDAVSHGNIGSLRPNDSTIIVKEGAQIMFINNDSSKRWVNGTIGTVIEFITTYDEEARSNIHGLKVKLENNKAVKVFPHTWEISKYIFKNGRFVREAIGHFTQMPLKLAWAVTIHKSQGKTFDNVIIDLGTGSFAHGQTYVALSRCTSLEGILLKRPILPSDIIVDNIIKSYNP